MAGRPTVIALEEHFQDAEPGALYGPLDANAAAVGHILFSVDWPFAPNKPATEWLHRIPLSAAGREKIASDNTRRILKL